MTPSTPRIVDQLKTPYTHERLAGLLAAVGLRPHDVSCADPRSG